MDAPRSRGDHGPPVQDGSWSLRRLVLWPPVRGATQLASTSWVGRATGNQPSSHRLPGPVPVQSATFVGKEELDEFREPWIWWRERDD